MTRPAAPKLRVRFLREAKATARLHHPNIVPVFDAGGDTEVYYLAAQYIHGRTLEDELQHHKLDWDWAADVCRRLADALAYAHRLGIVHRDVKTSNVMVDDQGDVHLMDFGLAQVRGSDERLTREGAVLGTAAYMAPEQASPKFGHVGPRSDQYSLGVVLYELLCGQVPFSGPPQVVLYHVTSSDPVPPRSVVSAVPRDLETICLKAMAKRPEGRYRDCGELAEDLRRWLAGEAITCAGKSRRTLGKMVATQPARRFPAWRRRPLAPADGDRADRRLWRGRAARRPTRVGGRQKGGSVRETSFKGERIWTGVKQDRGNCRPLRRNFSPNGKDWTRRWEICVTS